MRSGEVVRALSSTNVGSNPGDDAICGLNLLLVLSFAAKFFFRVLRFSPVHKSQHFQIPIPPGIADVVLPLNCYFYFCLRASQLLNERNDFHRHGNDLPKTPRNPKSLNRFGKLRNVPFHT